MWVKRGLVYQSPMWSQLPTVEEDGDVFRVFYSRRDAKNMSHVYCIEVDADNPVRVLRVYEEPTLTPGERGCFDDCGVMPACVTKVDGKRVLYYTGWNKRGTVPYSHAIGMAYLDARKDRSDFAARHSYGPVLDRGPRVPYLCNSPSVLRAADGTYQMWFSNGTGWDGDFPTYVIQKATSSDGVNWAVTEHSLGCATAACARPHVIQWGDHLRMWYSQKYKGGRYVIRAAYAGGNGRWVHVDSGLVISRSGWDSEMVCYPCVVRRGTRMWMFYNGNNYGESGIGVAEWTGE